MLGVGVSLRHLRGTTAAVPAAWVLFIPSGSDRLLTSNGDTFKVKEA